MSKEKSEFYWDAISVYDGEFCTGSVFANNLDEAAAIMQEGNYYRDLVFTDELTYRNGCVVERKSLINPALNVYWKKRYTL